MPKDRQQAASSMSREQLQEKIKHHFHLQPHEEQIDAIQHLVNQRDDLILIAKTGWGKSLIFQCIPLLHPDKNICLLIVPLNLLEEDQASHINEIDGCAACILNATTNTAALRNKIKDGEYTHVLTSPEIVLHKKFLPVLHNEQFRHRLALVGIDELHVAEQWGKSFRPGYSQLNILRARLGPSVPWFGTSATLDPAMLQAVKASAGFEDDVKIIITNIDRPDIFYNLQRIERPMASYEDLYFLTQPVLQFESVSGQASETHIPKTVIYCDHISEIVSMVKQLRLWTNLENSTQVVVPYHSELSEETKSKVSKEFVKPDSDHRIVVATDAMGIRVNNPDIRRVVNWKVPSSLCALMQRAGRAARSTQITGEFIWFIQPSYFSEEVGISQIRLQSQKVPQKKRKRLDQSAKGGLQSESDSNMARKDSRLKRGQKEKRMELPTGMREIVSGGCARQMIMNFFGQQLSASLDICCSRCNPERAYIQRLDNSKPLPRMLTSEDAWAPSWKKSQVKKALEQWRKSTATIHFADSLADPPAREMALEPKVMDRWVDHCCEMTTIAGFRKRASGWSWVDYDNFAEELTKVIHDTMKSPYSTQRQPLQPIDCNQGSEISRKKPRGK